MKCLTILLTLLAFGKIVDAQQPLNLDFEQTSVEGMARPWGWTQWQVGANTTCALDATAVKHGKLALHISNEDSTDTGKSSNHSLAHWISPHELIGWTCVSQPGSKPAKRVAWPS